MKESLDNLLVAVTNNSGKLIESLLKGVESLEISSEEKRIGTLFIDCQIDFIIGTLAVPGADKDVERIVLWIYKNMYKITTIAVTKDSHVKESIFFETWWKDKDGNHPNDYTIITYDDVLNGIWIPCLEKEYSLEYMQYEKEVIIWPYHCISTKNGSNVDSRLQRFMKIHEVLRKTQSVCLKKGEDPKREMFGALKPSYDIDNIYLNKKVIKYIDLHELIVIAGIAGSHCVPETINQILEYYKESDEIIQKLVILQDCISPVTGFEDIQESEMKKFKALGIKFVNSAEFNL